MHGVIMEVVIIHWMGCYAVIDVKARVSKADDKFAEYCLHVQRVQPHPFLVCCDVLITC